jgi:hypothetical protein
MKKPAPADQAGKEKREEARRVLSCQRLSFEEGQPPPPLLLPPPLPVDREPRDG